MDPHEHARLAEHEEWYWWHRARQSIVQRVLARAVAPGGRILDVGCGTGATSVGLRPLGRVFGTDIGDAALRTARERGLEVVRASATRLPAAPGAFDAVVALDVLEHLDDDVGAAREMRAALRPGGVLLATVPAWPSLWSRHDEALGHRRRYRRAGLVEVIRRADLELELCSYVMSSILPVAAVVRLLDRLRSPRADGDRSGYVPVPEWVNDALTGLVSLDGHLLRWVRLPFGLSLIAVARRRS